MPRPRSPSPPAGRRPPSRPADPEEAPAWLPAAVAAIVALFAILATTSLLSESQTSDEAIHLAAGLAHLTRADFVLNPEHPPLAKEIAAAPLLLMKVSLPVEDPSWDAAHRSAFQLPLGERFLYRNGVPFAKLLTAGRMPIVALGALLCLTVFAFSRRLFGWRAGLVSLGLCALCPNVLAHARLVTTDLAVSFFLLLSLLSLHRYLASRSARDLLLTGGAAGLTLASKFSAVVVLPAVLAVMALDRGGAEEDRSRPWWSRGWILPGAVATATALAVLSATYGVVHLPVYFEGLAGVFSTVTGGSEAFLMGSYSDTGWWYYYPVAMMLKTPIPALILFALIPVCYLQPAARRARSWRRHLVLLVPLALFAAASLASARDVGLRHVLPLYPILFVLAGQVAGDHLDLPWLPAARRRAGRAALVLLGLWYAGGTLWTHPAYLAYFNELGGGPVHARELLSDSNIDWGQDFIRLQRFVKSQGVADILLAHYGNQDPAYYGIEYQYLPGAGHIKPPTPHLLSSDRVLLAISVMTLQGMFVRDKQAYAWLERREPIARIGYSIIVYDLTKDREAMQSLADLYTRSRLPAQAAWARRRLQAMGAAGTAPEGA